MSSKGKLVEGKWLSEEEAKNSTAETTIIPSAIEDGHQYHLYVAMVCPFAHSALLALKLLHLENKITYSFVERDFGKDGWTFSERRPDPLNHVQYYHQVYTLSDPNFTGRATVPVLFDKGTKKIASNESWDIIKIFNSLRSKSSKLDLLPEDLISTADWKNIEEEILQTVNYGVYKVAFSPTEEARKLAQQTVFNTFASLDKRLEKSRFLFGNSITALDIRLFVTLVRYALAYEQLFGLNRPLRTDFKNLWGFTTDFHQQPTVAETVDASEIKEAYFNSFKQRHPSSDFDISKLSVNLNESHDRSKLEVKEAL